MYSKNLNAYKKQALSADMSVADPHRVIQLLMAGVLERLALAKGAIDRKDYAEKSTAISKSLGIINGLQDALDLSHGETAQQLYDLYDYMKDRLMDASLKMDKDAIDEVANLMLTVKSGWDQIPESEKQKAYAQQDTSKFV
ncbi:flagellar export chaperone FliS [Tolumonas lignilytica]|jgi:flagellar biosynthetic protein FliS|uniref:flagellar export chaperone FliS n=1 Tax=Tolumonas lignilytica TaxID=1283284 RepID=UPI000466FCB0|nr:flagellar export chaperone FliS [Tolumonas lignilytica]